MDNSGHEVGTWCSGWNLYKSEYHPMEEFASSLVDIADVVKKDDGPGESDVELAKVAPLHCFPSGLQT